MFIGYVSTQDGKLKLEADLKKLGIENPGGVVVTVEHPAVTPGEVATRLEIDLVWPEEGL